MAAASFPHVQAAEKYARDVVAGRIKACRWVKLACRRHLDDRKREKSKSYPYVFNKEKAEKVCRFVENLPHTKGRWAARNERMRLEPWQCFLTCCVFGWLRKSDKLRRFRKVFLLIPRKNGKSTMVAGWGLWMFVADEEYGAEVYSGATTEKQAWEVFRPARLMAQRTPALLSHYGVTVNASNLHVALNGSRFEPLIGKPGDGPSPSCAIHDEYHEHDTDEQVDSMETGMGAREQPLQVIITTAGDNLAGPCYNMQLDAQKVLEGALKNDELFACIYTIDKKDDWSKIDALKKANPNCGVSVSEDFLKSRLRDAQSNPRKQAVFKTKHLNMWVASRSAYFNSQRWIECGDPNLKIEDFAGQSCVVALDLATKYDIAARTIVFRHDGGYACFGKWYLPEETIQQPENEHYRGWLEEGWIEQTEGNINDFDKIKDDVIELCNSFRVEHVAFDPVQASILIQQLQKEGIPAVSYGQTVLNMSEPMKELDAAIRARTIRHNGDPVMTWMISNVVARPDKKDNVYPTKERAEDKIDGPVSLIMGMGVLLTMPEPAQPQVFWL